MKSFCCPKMRVNMVEKGRIISRNGRHYFRFLEYKGLGETEMNVLQEDFDYCPFCGYRFNRIIRGDINILMVGDAGKGKDMESIQAGLCSTVLLASLMNKKRVSYNE